MSLWPRTRSQICVSFSSCISVHGNPLQPVAQRAQLALSVISLSLITHIECVSKPCLLFLFFPFPLPLSSTSYLIIPKRNHNILWLRIRKFLWVRGISEVSPPICDRWSNHTPMMRDREACMLQSMRSQKAKHDLATYQQNVHTLVPIA